MAIRQHYFISDHMLIRKMDSAALHNFCSNYECERGGFYRTCINRFASVVQDKQKHDTESHSEYRKNEKRNAGS